MGGRGEVGAWVHPRLQLALARLGWAVESPCLEPSGPLLLPRAKMDVHAVYQEVVSPCRSSKSSVRGHYFVLQWVSVASANTNY